MARYAILIRLNVIVSVLLAVTLAMTGGTEIRFIDLALFAAMLSLAVLLLVEVVAILPLWRRHRRRAFLPLASLVICVAVGVALGVAGARLALWFQGSPQDPEKFLSGSRQEELTRAAADLLGRGSSRFRIEEGMVLADEAGRGPAVPRDGLLPASAPNPPRVPDEVLRTLSDHHMRMVRVDPARRLVMMGYTRRRTWVHYVYTSGGHILDWLPSSPVLTEASIRDWGVLIKIAGGRDDSSDRMTRDWTTARAELARELGPGFLARLKEGGPTAEIKEEERRRVLAALNRLIAFESRLSERIDRNSWSNCGPWVDRLAEELQKANALGPAGHGPSLVLPTDLGPSARRGVEWLHFGVVCSLFGDFGGLVQREPYLAGDFLLDRAVAAASTPLSGGWFLAAF